MVTGDFPEIRCLSYSNHCRILVVSEYVITYNVFGLKKIGHQLITNGGLTKEEELFFRVAPEAQVSLDTGRRRYKTHF